MRAQRTAVGVGLGVVAGAGVLSYLAGRRAVPSWSGTVRIPCLDAPVEVLRDAWGIPLVRAASEVDLFRAQGFLHAGDRLFQMDLLRRAGAGRLAEVVGSNGIGSDRLVRTFGFARHAREEVALLDESTRGALTAYAEGVNAWIDSSRGRLPVEFRLLGYRPERWRESDSLLPTRLMALSLCGNWQSELVRAEIASRYGHDALAIIDDNEQGRDFAAQIGVEVLGDLVTAARDATASIGLGFGTGSNSWVVGPRRTESGGALLANDPHLDLTLPSIWYEQVLRSPTLECRGFTIPGVPGVILGHNGRIAWGFTNSPVDVQDLYLEQVDEAAGTYRDVDGSDQPLTLQRERIRVKGGDDVFLEIRSTRRGPLITDAVAHHMDQPVSMRWDAVRPGRSSDAMFGVVRATDFEGFRTALGLWTAPAQNVVYADTKGNIGFQHAGEVPVRRGSDGTLPRLGDDSEGEWVGTAPYLEMPWAFNPSADRIITANDRLVDDAFPHFLSNEWMNGYRGDRIRELIDARERTTVEDHARIQVDVHSIPGARFASLLATLQPTPATIAGREVLDALLAWDGELRPDDDGAIAWRLASRALQEQAFGFIGDLLPRYLGFSRTGINGFWSLFGRSTPRLLAAIEQDDRRLLDTGARIHREHPADGWQPANDWQEAVELALDRAGRRWTAEHHGGEHHPQLSLPGTGRSRPARATRRHRFHRLRLQHPLGVVPGFAAIANRGPFAVGGDADTVWAAGAFNNATNDNAMVGPSHRNVVDLANLDGSMAVVCGGQSGHPASPHYADQVDMWRAGELRPAPWTDEALERAAKYRQQLLP